MLRRFLTELALARPAGTLPPARRDRREGNSGRWRDTPPQDRDAAQPNQERREILTMLNRAPVVAGLRTIKGARGGAP